MAIKLIKQDERYSVTVDGATFTYRRVPSFQQAAIETKHTKRGVEDKRAIVDGVLQYALVDWVGIEDENGTPVPFTSDLVKMLPEEAKAQLIEHLYASNPTTAALGN
jgi:hypothetical protein